MRPRGLAWKEHLDKEWVTYLRNRFDENYEIARHASLLFNFVWFDRGGVSRGDGGAGAGDASGGAP